MNEIRKFLGSQLPLPKFRNPETPKFERGPALRGGANESEKYPKSLENGVSFGPSMGAHWTPMGFFGAPKGAHWDPTMDPIGPTGAPMDQGGFFGAPKGAHWDPNGSHWANWDPNGPGGLLWGPKGGPLGPKWLPLGFSL